MTIKNATVKNVTATVALQIITLLCGFAVPRVILDGFGSEVNGLVTSITQFLSYISLVEGGVGSVVLANLYSPLANGEKEKVSAIVITAERFFKRLAVVFLLYQGLLVLVYPLLVSSTLGWGYISSLIVILGISTFVQYYFSLTWRLFLQADKKVYISAFAQGAAVVLNLVVTVLTLRVFPSIHVVKFAAGMMYLIQPVILSRYISKHYELRDDVLPDSALLSQRWDGFGINLAAMVHATTATVVLTFVTGLSSVSVFSIYMLVANGLKSLITSISSGVVPTMGRHYGRGDLERCGEVFDLYDTVMFSASFFCFTVAAVTVAPFVMLYTSGVTDADYYQPALGVVLMLAECMFCIREPYVNMAYTAGHFRQVSKYAYCEALANILVSVVLAFVWGMVGVAVGLLISISYRTLAQVWYLRGNILGRSPFLFAKKLAVFALASLLAATLSLLLWDIGDLSVVNWVLYAAKVCFVELVAVLTAILLLDARKVRSMIRKMVWR